MRVGKSIWVNESFRNMTDYPSLWTFNQNCQRHKWKNVSRGNSVEKIFLQEIPKRRIRQESKISSKESFLQHGNTDKSFLPIQSDSTGGAQEAGNCFVMTTSNLLSVTQQEQLLCKDVTVFIPLHLSQHESFTCLKKEVFFPEKKKKKKKKKKKLVNM